MTSEATLTYQVYVAPIIAMAGKDVPPGQSRSTWSPISATLISGRHDAVLVDPLMTVEQGMAVADWVSTTGKNLTTVYVTHGHGDHARSGNGRVLATAETLAIMRARCRDGCRTGSQAGTGVGIARTAHSAHRQDSSSCRCRGPGLLTLSTGDAVSRVW